MSYFAWCIILALLVIKPEELFCEQIGFFRNEDGEPGYSTLNKIDRRKEPLSMSLRRVKRSQSQQIGPDEEQKPDQKIFSNIVIEPEVVTPSPTTELPETEDTIQTEATIQISPDFAVSPLQPGNKPNAGTQLTQTITNLPGSTGYKSDNVTGENCPSCQPVPRAAKMDDLDLPPRDTYHKSCKPESELEDCVHLVYLRCKNDTKQMTVQCECRSRMQRAKIRSGKNKGITWCLVKDNEECTNLETKNEDCMSGRCEYDNKCAQRPNFSGAEIISARRFRYQHHFMNFFVALVIVIGTVIN